MERYTHVTAARERLAADLLDRALTAPVVTVTMTVTDPADGVVDSGPEQRETGPFVRESGSGGRTRTYDQAVNSRPLYH
jgi:hypothetical protein